MEKSNAIMIGFVVTIIFVNQLNTSELPDVMSGESPIAINKKETYPINLTNIQFKYRPESFFLKQKNDGNKNYTVFENKNKMIYIIVDAKKFYLKEFHFHIPAEHTIDGQKFDLELHIVHQSDDNEIAVIGVLFKQNGVANNELEKCIQAVQHDKEKTEPLNLKNLLPSDKRMYRYHGSLTGQPFSINVRWIICQKNLFVSKKQLFLFTKYDLAASSREVQPQQKRAVLLDVA